jgi:hypothetical protein
MQIPAIIRAGSLGDWHRKLAARAAIILAASTLCCAAHAGSITLTCGEPSLPGVVNLGLVNNFDGSGPVISATTFIEVNIPGTDSASDKCLAISNAINASDNLSWTATPSGNTVIITGTGGISNSVLIDGDTTAESSSLSATVQAGDAYQFQLLPTLSPNAVPASGTDFNLGILLANGATDGATATGDGTQTSGELLIDGLLSSFCSQGACFNTTFQIPGMTGFDVGSQIFTVPGSGSQDFQDSIDPTVEIASDANTAEYLATIGLTVYSAPETPEPGSLYLTALGLAGVLFASRGRKLARRLP